MLFHSYLFLLCFLPCCLVAYYVLWKWKQPRAAIGSLIAFSLLFYGWWNVAYLWLLVGSIVANYAVSRLLLALRSNERARLTVLVAAVLANLAVLANYKYVCLLQGQCETVILPLAISFFTFQQIEFLLDTWSGKVAIQKFTNYALFVTFFPHLIAGPITRHSEMMPQFEKPGAAIANNLSIGLTIFAIGLAKKAFLADPLAPLALAPFETADSGEAVLFFPAWFGAVAFTLQLYFDFSGYSDMAIGIARMFGIKLPLNFDSPFKAINITDFWQRWHLTLTRYIMAHLYNPIVTSLARRAHDRLDTFHNMVVVMALPTIAVMTIAGIWHGAGGQFVIFGAMHGVMLAGHRMFRWGAQRSPRLESFRRILPIFICVLVTFGLVVVSFVFFKASSVRAALDVLKGMSALSLATDAPAIKESGIWNHYSTLLGKHHMIWQKVDLLVVPFSLLFVWFAPNTQQIMAAHLNGGGDQTGEPVRYAIRPWSKRFGTFATWQPRRWVGVLVAAMIIAALVKAHYYQAAFLYFRF